VGGVVASAVGEGEDDPEQAVVAPIRLAKSSPFIKILIIFRVMQKSSLVIFT
jgi:hypothetical protein